MRRYWIYKCNVAGGPAGYWGDWLKNVFSSARTIQWGGDYSTRSDEVRKRLADEVAPGDVVIAYQTDLRSIVGFCRVTQISGSPGERRLFLEPIERLEAPFPIHQHKRGTSLADSTAVNGMVMLRELDRTDMALLVQLTGVPRRVLAGRARAGGYQP